MTTEPDIAVHARDLAKVFKVGVREPGLRASMRSVVRRTTRDVRAVDGVDLDIRRGEIVGFLGPNGAGKTTTLKMLSGLLHQSSGTTRVLGHDPRQRERTFLRRIALIMGQRHQLEWDLPAADTFAALRTVYALDHSAWREQLDELTELLDLGELVDKPVRQLSLGERMKCELAGGLLHRPDVLFLDEPTLGLDVQAQRKVREFIARYAERTGATVLLTSHYMADIEALAERVLVIDHGQLRFNGPLRELVERTSDRKRVTVVFATGSDAARDESVARQALAAAGAEIVEIDGAECVLDVSRADVRNHLARLVDVPDVVDFTVADEPVERIIERVFAGSPS